MARKIFAVWGVVAAFTVCPLISYAEEKKQAVDDTAYDKAYEACSDIASKQNDKYAEIFTQCMSEKGFPQDEGYESEAMPE